MTIGKDLAGMFRDVVLPVRPQPELDDDLVNAAIAGDLDTAVALLGEGANPNADHSLAMCIAVSREDAAMLGAFLAAGKASVPNETPLVIAIVERKWKMAMTLIDHGANLDALTAYITEDGSEFHRKALADFRQVLESQPSSHRPAPGPSKAEPHGADPKGNP
jgi:hypothetical protein